MSYEGYSQFLCTEGHYWTIDCYFIKKDNWCSICCKKAIWGNMVNDTNGCEPSDNYEALNTNWDFGDLHKEVGDCICGYIPLEKVKNKKCSKCGTNLDLEQIFKIPKKRKKKCK